MGKAEHQVMVGLSDRDLVIRFQEGDVAAYEEMYRRYSNRVRATCARMLLNPEDVDEAVQETFLKAYQALHRFNGRYMLPAWLARIASNVCLDHMRSVSRGGKVIVLPPEAEIAGEQRGPEEVFVEGTAQLRETFSDMQPLHAHALLMRAHEGLSHQEMAGELEMTPTQVKALLHRARRSFRRAWDKTQALATAPILVFRSRRARSRGAAESAAPQAPHLAGMAPSLSPFVERVATTAVAMAVALSGAPDSRAPRDVVEPPPVGRDGDGDDRLDRPVAARGGGPSAAGAERRAIPTLTEEATALVEDLEVPIEEPPEPPEETADDGDDGGDLTSPSASDAKKVERKAKRILDDLPD